MVVAMMNVPIEEGDAELFFNTIKKLISSGKGGLSLTYPRTSLLELFNNFESLIQINPNNKLFTNTKISELTIKNNTCSGVITVDNVIDEADFVVSTLPPHNLANLSEHFVEYREIFNNSSLLSAYI